MLTIAAALASAMLTVQTPAGADLVIHPDDAQMTCEGLAAAINDLSGEIRAQEQRAETARNAGRVGRGLLSGLARGAGMFGYGGGDAAAAAVAVTAAAGVADQMAAQSGGQSAPTATVQQQRLTHLNGLYASRPC